MKYWITKFVPTQGIIEADIDGDGRGDQFAECSSEYVYYEKHFRSYRIGRDIFTDKIRAVEKAHEILNKKIASLKKQIGKLEQAKLELRKDES